MEQKPTTESKTFNQEYRDKLAEELREQRANGNSEKAKDTLSHEQGGVFYDKAKQTHQEGDQLKVRASSSEERIKKLIEEHNNKFNTSLEFSKEEKEIQDAIKAVEEMGAEVSEIEGRIADSENTEEDVKNFIRSQVTVNQGTVQKKETSKHLEEYPHEEFGEVSIKDIPRVKKLSGPHLVRSWTEIPHVTQHDEIDVTEMEQFRSSLRDLYTGQKISVTPLAFIMRAMVNALKAYPNFNTSLDPENGKVVYKKYFLI